MNVYKFQDLFDRNFAFVIAESEEKAGTMLLETTVIPFEMIESKNIEDIAKIQNYYEIHGESIYINNIVAF